MKFFTKNAGLGLLMIVFLYVEGYAQEPNFSMYHYSPLFTNPGQLGTVEGPELMVNYRNQAIEEGDNFTTSSLSAIYPLHIGNHQLVLAGNFLNDKASDFVSTNGGLLGVAYTVSLSASSTLSMGIQGGYYQRKTESEFVTDDQFIDGALNPTAISRDAVLNRNTGYATLSGGLFYRLLDANGMEKAFVGGSVFNVVEPDVSLVEGNSDNLSMSLKATAGYRLYQGPKLSVTPTMRWVNQSGNDFLNLGSRLGYAIAEVEEGVKRIELGLWYHTNDLGIVSIAYEQPAMTVGVSYDLPVGQDLNEVQNGIFELVVALRLGNKSNPEISGPSDRTSEGSALRDEK